VVSDEKEGGVGEGGREGGRRISKTKKTEKGKRKDTQKK
jgi:hypothetical protein